MAPEGIICSSTMSKENDILSEPSHSNNIHHF